MLQTPSHLLSQEITMLPDGTELWGTHPLEEFGATLYQSPDCTADMAALLLQVAQTDRSNRSSANLSSDQTVVNSTDNMAVKISKDTHGRWAFDLDDIKVNVGLHVGLERLAKNADIYDIPLRAPKIYGAIIAQRNTDRVRTACIMDHLSGETPAVGQHGLSAYDRYYRPKTALQLCGYTDRDVAVDGFLKNYFVTHDGWTRRINSIAVTGVRALK